MFQPFIDHVTSDLLLASTSIDHILVASHAPQEHQHHLSHRFAHLSSYELIKNVKNFVLRIPEFESLGRTFM